MRQIFWAIVAGLAILVGLCSIFFALGFATLIDPSLDDTQWWAQYRKNLLSDLTMPLGYGLVLLWIGLALLRDVWKSAGPTNTRRLRSADVRPIVDAGEVPCDDDRPNWPTS